MTYTYIDNNGEPITNVYNARDSYAIIINTSLDSLLPS